MGNRTGGNPCSPTPCSRANLDAEAPAADSSDADADAEATESTNVGENSKARAAKVLDCDYEEGPEDEAHSQH